MNNSTLGQVSPRFRGQKVTNGARLAPPRAIGDAPVSSGAVGRVSVPGAASCAGAEGAAQLAPGSGVGPTPGGALGITARFSTGRGELSPKVRRFMLQAGARELLPGERVADCLRKPIGGSVSVLYSPKHRAGHLGGLQTCGSCWQCPVCQAKVGERRADELSQGVKAWSGQLFLVTLTLQHTPTDALGELLGSLTKASYGLRTGDWWTRFQKRHGLAGTVRALEVTHGGMGWHPHLHVLFFCSADADVERFHVDLRDRWAAVVAKQGRYVSPRWGIDVRSANEEIAEYLAKFGKEQYWSVARELAKSSSKNAYGSGHSMNELLEQYVVAGDRRAGALWQEYARAFKGRKQLVYSRGLRAVLGLVADEKTDEEVAAEEIEDAVVLAVLTLAQWRVILANDARGELCDVASSGDADRVRVFLGSLGVEVEPVTWGVDDG